MKSANGSPKGQEGEVFSYLIEKKDLIGVGRGLGFFYRQGDEGREDDISSRRPYTVRSSSPGWGLGRSPSLFYQPIRLQA